MPKRQIFLLALMGLAVVFGAYSLLTADSGKSAGGKDIGPQLDGIVKSVQAAVDKERLSDLEAFRLSRVRPEAVGDPFLRAPEDAEGGEEYTSATDENGRFVFSGVISVGRASFAIINDSEYKVGETVDETGFVLADIRPDAVVLRGRDPQSGALQNLMVPIQDDLINFVEDGDAEK